MQPKAALVLPVDVPSHHSCLLHGLDLAGETGDTTWENSSNHEKVFAIKYNCNG